MEPRITSNPKIFGGKPIIRGMRIPVEMILDLMGQGMSEQEILDEYPVLERDDLAACLRNANGASDTPTPRQDSATGSECF